VWQTLRPDERGHVLIPPKLSRYAAVLGINSTPGHEFGDVALCAGWTDAAGAMGGRAGRKLALMEHGVGQSYTNCRVAAYAGGVGRQGVDLFLCPNDRVRQLNMNWPGRHGGDCVIVGDPYLDQLRWQMQSWVRMFDVTFAWHWDHDIVPEMRSAFSWYRDAVVAISQTDIAVLGHGHPRDWAKQKQWYAQHNIMTAGGLPAAIACSRVFAADNTSAMFYAMAMDRPIIFLNAPWYRKNVEHGLRFWEYADAGEQVDNPDKLQTAIRALLEDPLKYAQVKAELFPLDDGLSAVRICEALRSIC